VCAIEDAGFEIRDQLAWAFGSGFPKSLDVSKAIDAAAGAKREVIGTIPDRWTGAGNTFNFSTDREQSEVTVTGGPATAAAAQWQGWGTALKPAFEPIVLARKPLIGTVAANVLAHGTGGLNIDGCRVGGDERPLVTSDRRLENNTYSPGLSGSKSEGVTSLGRWPANLLHDGSDEVLAAFPSAPGQQGDLNASAARFFYCAKASGRDRNEGLDGLATVAAGALNMRSDAHAAANGNLPAARANTHPTVKPTDLMRYLCRLITPPGGLVLDPFMGSGSTGKAAVKEGFRFVGIDLSDEYVTIAERRIAHAAFGPAAFGGAAA
jgi:site-specific DNA-methyltransferase (adenine-specific)